MKYWIIAITLFFLNFSFAKTNPIDDLKIMTENFPPFNFSEQESLKGFSVEIFAEMLKRAGSKLTPANFTLLPWARGYALIKKDKNACLFSMRRTKEREKLFQWVGPIAPSESSLIGLKSTNLTIKSIQDAEKYRVQTIIDDASEQLLIKKGFPKEKLDRMSGSGNVLVRVIKKFNAGRIDLFAYNIIPFRWTAKKNGYDPSRFVSRYSYSSKSFVYYAFNKNVSYQIIVKLQKALDSMKKDGSYQKILDKYLK